LKIRLVRKLAERLEGIDLGRYRVNDLIDLPRREAMLLMAHGWAVRADPSPAPPQPRTDEEPV
jgi:hypothetical protein